MRRSTLATLANLARVASLGVSLVAAGTAALWVWAPATIARGEEWLRDQCIGSTLTRWASAQSEPDPRRQAQQCEDLLADLESVRPDHRFAPIVAGLHRRLTDLALTRGDRPSAAAWLRAAVAFDSDAVDTRLELGDLLCQQPASVVEGISLLQSLVERPSGAEALHVPTFPGQPRITATLATHLLRNGRAREAIDVLDRARREPPPSLWTVTVRGTDGTESTAEFVPQRNGDILHLSFRLREATADLQLALPPGASAELIAPQLTVTTTRQALAFDLLDASSSSLQDLVRRGDRVLANGDGKPAFTLHAAIERGATVHLQAGWRERPPERLLAVARMPQFAELGSGLTTAADSTRFLALRNWLQTAEAPR